MFKMTIFIFIFQDFDVSGYPTLKWFKKGGSEPEKYNGGRTADDMAKVFVVFGDYIQI